MIPARDIKRLKRIAAAALVVTAVTAVMALPTEVLPWPWLAALTAPAALLGLRRTQTTRPFLMALAATILQLSACILAYQLAGSISRPAALVGAILPPLTFVVVRRQDVDSTLGLFLSLCVLLIGMILSQPHILLLATFVIGATTQLRCETRLAALTRCSNLDTNPATASRLPAISGIGLGLLCTLAGFAVERSLGTLPSLTERDPGAAPAATGNARTAGLSDSFNLDGDGELISLQGELLVEVQPVDRGPTPADLYLRSGMFQKPGLDSWTIGPVNSRQVNTTERPLRLKRPVSGYPVRTLELTRTEQALDRVFTPDGICSIYGLGNLRVDSRRRWFRGANQLPSIYEVTYQQPRISVDTPIDDTWRTRLLMEVPVGAQEHFQQLLDEWQPSGSPLEKARTIAEGLQERCTYVRQEPTGPSAMALVNFLHGGRSGFCMHFASAAAILLRMVEVPCRIGVGLYGGVAQGPSKPVLFGSQHAHAWVEIPLAGHGWVIFDPTPPVERGINPASALGSGDAAPAEAAPELQETHWADWLASSLGDLFRSPWPWVAIVVLLVLPIRRRKTRASAQSVRREVRPARRLLLAILSQLTQNGRPRPAGKTIEQHAMLLEHAGMLPADLQDAFQAYQEVRFGGRQWDPEQEDRMRRGLAAAQDLKPLAD